MSYSRKNPFPARLVERRLLTLEGADKETLHFAVSLEGSGLVYEAGDSLGVFPCNDPVEVETLLTAAGLRGDEAVVGASGVETPLREVLTQQVTLREPSKQLLAAILAKCPEAEDELSELLDPEAKKALDDWVDGRDVLDILRAYPQARFEAAELVKVLRKLQPRLYSIASSPKMFPEEAHLTVAVIRYDLHGRRRQGICTTFLADRAEGKTFPVFIHSAKHFRPPEDLSVPLIMVGPGTGVAAFRAFLQDREVSGASGKTWLFFGGRSRDGDFFYEEEMKAWLAQGVLGRLDTAFSRDQAHKIYVQDRMMENAAELWQWFAEGACFYVCGDAERMAKDVDETLHRIAMGPGGLTREGAEAWVDELKKAKRYRKDVY